MTFDSAFELAQSLERAAESASAIQERKGGLSSPDSEEAGESTSQKGNSMGHSLYTREMLNNLKCTYWMFTPTTSQPGLVMSPAGQAFPRRLVDKVVADHFIEMKEHQ